MSRIPPGATFRVAGAGDHPPPSSDGVELSREVYRDGKPVQRRRLWAAVRAATKQGAVASGASGPVLDAVLQEELSSFLALLEERGVRFFEHQTGWRKLFVQERPLPAAEFGRLLSQGRDQNLRLQVGNDSIQDLESLADLQELDAACFGGDPTGIREANVLRSFYLATKAGFRPEKKPVEAFFKHFGFTPSERVLPALNGPGNQVYDSASLPALAVLELGQSERLLNNPELGARFRELIRTGEIDQESGIELLGRLDRWGWGYLRAHTPGAAEPWNVSKIEKPTLESLVSVQSIPIEG